MRNDTRRLFNAYLAKLAQINNVESATQSFNVDPSVAQTLENRIQESSAFLQRVNMVPVSMQSGEKVGLGVGGPIAGTTDTTAQDRQTSDPTELDKSGYFCTQTNFDTHLRYPKLDAWRQFKDFQARIRDAILRRQALDRIMIGFNGVARAATSDKVANPMLQDVNVGWLQKYRLHSPQRVMSEVVDASGEVTYGAGGDYANLDAIVYDAVNNLIEPWYQEDTELVAICGRALMHDKYFPLVDSEQAPTEQLARDIIISQKRIGGLPAVRVPSFPANAVLVTRLDNLSIYWQEETRRRNVVDNSKRDRVENYESVNEAYVVEDYGCGALIENITPFEP
ncbi:phage major capsid protein, P2 family [Halopseudomonas oceani]|uniref:phage major capsid protein, P2 family n=1 Tax=Halopseudomonas oceani TaxID=1708783 RepID=UPI002AA87BD7|nr:phage major capsid protein, P2 family [Halopseudomonas oceani]